MKEMTFAKETIQKRIKEKMVTYPPSFQDYSEHSDYLDYGDSNSDWT